MPCMWISNRPPRSAVRMRLRSQVALRGRHVVEVGVRLAHRRQDAGKGDLGVGGHVRRLWTNASTSWISRLELVQSIGL